MNPNVTIYRFGLVLLVVLFAFAGCASRIDQAPDESILLATTPAPLQETWALEWWIPRHEEKLAARNRAVELVMIGDSITHGWEDPGKEVWAHRYGDIAMLNLGFSGDRTENVLWRLEHGEVDGLAPRLAVIMIGTNNTGHRMDPPEAIAAGVGKILDELNTRLPDTKVLLLAIFPRGETPSDPMRVNNDKTNLLLADLAVGKGVDYADFNAAFLAGDGVLEKAIMPDLLHPNEAGYEIWARQLQPWIDKYLNRQQALTVGTSRYRPLRPVHSSAGR